ncbi:MAG TPA: hypothetical protein VFR16_15635 [Agromyces mariniharenae]|nr:hypothetical protein [Agromyces mariniharenae]
MNESVVGILVRVLLWPVEWLLEAAFGAAFERFRRWVGTRAEPEERFDSGIRIVSGRQPGFTVGWREGVATLRRGVIDFEERVIKVVAVESDAFASDDGRAAPGAGRVILRIRAESAELDWAVAEGQADAALSHLERGG